MQVFEMIKARDVSCLMDTDEPSRVISVQMQLVAMQWLTTNHNAFNSDHINQSVLERIIRQNCRRPLSMVVQDVDVFHMSSAGIPHKFLRKDLHCDIP
ncbi:hypothetical protein RB195_023401 [Necator americanus]|uniref:Uncharacterized protein n=1 Tax=Necator americanus TaxID=51031 RepID=A0ABR1EJ27_NECAM